MIGGFILLGADDKKVLIRGLGPSLSAQVPGALADTTLELHSGDGTLLAINDNWKSDQQAEIEPTTIPPTNDLELAIVSTLPANGAAYTAILGGKNGGTGIGLVEAYDLDTPANSKLANISTRGFVDTADKVLIGGFILSAGQSDVIVRAIGPSLPGSVTVPCRIQPWSYTTATGCLSPPMTIGRTSSRLRSKPPASRRPRIWNPPLVSSLPSGSYTAIVRGKNDTTGVGLVEIYSLN